MAPRVEYATTADGVRIAFAICGRERTVVPMPPIPFRHIQLEWELSDDRRWLEWLSNNLGEYVVSDDPNYDPNIGSNLHWDELPRAR